MSALVKIDFHGDTLFAQEQDDGVIVVAVKPIIERLGLDWASQFSRLKRSESLEGSIVKITMETPAGPRETIGLPLNLLPGFLFGISTGSIADPDTKAAVLAYQRECHEVLFRHFFGRPADAAADLDWESIHAKIHLVREARLTIGRKAAASLWAQLGLPQLEAAAASTSPALQGVDFVRQFLAECTVDDVSGRVQATILFQSFDQWIIRQNGPRMTSVAFGRCLTALGRHKTTSHNVFYLGLRLKHISEMMG